MSSTVKLSIVNFGESKYASLTLSNPNKINALDESMLEQLNARVEEIIVNKDLFAVVIQGEGGSFSAGGDLDMLERKSKLSIDENREGMLKFYSQGLSLIKLPIPTIACIENVAVGAAMGIALGCTFRLIDRQAKIAFRFTEIGLHPGMGTSHLLPLICGIGRAQDLLLTGRFISGEESLAMGICQYLFEKDQKQEAINALLSQLLKQESNALRALVKTFQTKINFGMQEALVREAESQAENFTNPDFVQRIRALKEKSKVKKVD